MSDVLLAEIIRLASIVLSISIVNFVVGYRKNCDIDKWKNIAIQSVIVVIIFIISKYIDVMNLSIIYNEKTNYIENYFSLFSIIKNFDFSIINLIWITVNIVIIVSMTLIYNKIYSVFIMLKILVRFAEMHGPFQIEQYLIIMEVVPQLAIIAITVTIYIVIEMKKENEERIKEKQAYNRLETKNDYYEKVEESQNQIRRLYHDMNNHLYNIQMMNKSSEDASDYIVSLQNELKEARKTRVSGNSLFDIIVDEKMNICQSKGIDFKIDVDSKNTGFIKNMDMSSILANILDNAIEACDKMTSNKKYIKLTSMWSDDMFVIICENSKENEVKKIGDRFITDKLNKSEHGIGIKSVEKSVKNYDGNMMIFCDDSLFKVKIMIPKK